MRCDLSVSFLSPASRRSYSSTINKCKEL